MLLEPSRSEARKILQDGEQTSAEIIDAAVDVASTGFRQLAGATVLRRQGWLRSTSFRPEVQAKIIDMPFNGELLFGQHVDDALNAIKKDTETAKALGTLQFRKPPFRGARGRGFLFQQKRLRSTGLVPVLSEHQSVSIPTSTALRTEGQYLPAKQEEVLLSWT